MSGHIEVQDAASVMGQHQEHVKYLEVDRRHREEVDRNHLLGVILQGCAPGLRWRFARAHHVFADTALSDADAEFEKFAVDPWCTPVGILSAHLADQFSDLAGNDQSSRLAAPHLPGPEQAKAGTMPGNDCFWLDDDQGRAPVMLEAGEADPQQAVGGGQFQAFYCSSLKHGDLVAQSQVLEFEGRTRSEDRAQRREQCREKSEHQRE
jgi:hypothetical protein